MNDESKRLWKKAKVVYFAVLSRNFLGGAEE
jgi:hypothetical protein